MVSVSVYVPVFMCLQNVDVPFVICVYGMIVEHNRIESISLLSGICGT